MNNKLVRVNKLLLLVNSKYLMLDFINNFSINICIIYYKLYIIIYNIINIYYY